MSVSGALFDLNKLNDVSKNVIAAMDADAVTAAVLAWAQEQNPSLYEQLNTDRTFARGIFAIDRGGAKPRKDLAHWSEVPAYVDYFFNRPTAYPWPENLAAEDIRAILAAYPAVYDPTQDKQAWFNTIKDLCPSLGFCSEIKEYKKAPDQYKGHAGDVSTVIRIAVTGRRNTPDLCGIMSLLGTDEIKARLAAASEAL